METKDMVGVLSALAQETRLGAFRLLVSAGEGGIPAGELGRELGIPHNTLSFHLAHLERAGLVTTRRQGRSILYTANFPCMQDLIRSLAANCCSRDFASVRNDRGQRRTLIELAGCCGKGARQS